MTYDQNPSLNNFDPDAAATYAARLDEENPGWWWDDLDAMDPRLAEQALARRAAEEG